MDFEEFQDFFLCGVFIIFQNTLRASLLLFEVNSPFEVIDPLMPSFFDIGTFKMVVPAFVAGHCHCKTSGAERIPSNFHLASANAAMGDFYLPRVKKALFSESAPFYFGHSYSPHLPFPFPYCSSSFFLQ
jgi:hypothetical protein